MPEQIWWYTSRASGIVAYFLLFAVSSWGVLLMSRLADRYRRRPWMLDMHKWLGGMAVAMTAVHMGALVADSYLHFETYELAVPFYSDYQRAATGAGVIAMWLVALVQASSLVMRSLPRRLWKGIHLASYAAFLLASLHGTYSGTDASNPIYVFASSAVVALFVIALIDRVLFARTRSRSPKAAATQSP